MRPIDYVVKLIIITVFISGPIIKAQEKNKDSLTTTWELLKYDGVSAFGGLKKTYSQPIRWQKDDFLTAGAIVTGTAVLYIFDDEANEWFRNQEDDVPMFIQDFGWYYGSPQNNYAVNGAVYLYGLFTRNEKVRRTGVLMISAATTAGIIQSILKTAVGRARPKEGAGKGDFKPFSSEPNYHSFPSGHTILSFTTAYALSKQFENPFVKAGILGVGLIPPASRLWEGAHWFTDVGLSLALSVLVVDSIDNYLKRERDYGKNEIEGISWNFQVGLGRIGITGRF
ncbi:phosphatase PAP2 family protein [Christiangramia crocea]|uniref:Phosphatase PAP2 family protein n=1 Tax=Christiangramia crocea TaxID=2904124 RepID=A0A9X1UVZ0_9FLAO|nr:phosphatase PAP2 family protein [Gramella crocea]MCG9971095.1 phosphatase PAP2 family protein [Gramella crocea]